MDKIICEVCGTTYPEVSAQCPICGYAKPQEAKSVLPTESTSGKYQYVRGGRFSSSNVRKRNENRDVDPVYRSRENVPQSRVPQNPKTAPKTAKKSTNFIFGIIAIILLVILILALAWFIVDIVGERFAMVDLPTTGTAAGQKQDPVISLDMTDVLLEEAGASVTVTAQVVPADPDAVFTFTSGDPSVATVDDAGVITAVAPGTATITVSSGALRSQISVTCEFTVPSGSTGAEEFELNRDDITFDQKGATWDLCGVSVTIPKNKITWTSDDETVAKIADGIVEAVGPGTTKVYGEYDDKKLSCTIRCKFEDDSATDPTGEAATGEATISHKDVTIAVDESFTLLLRDSNKKALEVEWKVSADGVVTIDGNKITGTKGGENVIVSATYEGKTYKCTVRVKKN